MDRRNFFLSMWVGLLAIASVATFGYVKQRYVQKLVLWYSGLGWRQENIYLDGALTHRCYQREFGANLDEITAAGTTKTWVRA